MKHFTKPLQDIVRTTEEYQASKSQGDQTDILHFIQEKQKFLENF
jgi:hypothetical protein